jgi:hypothetical protein
MKRRIKNKEIQEIKKWIIEPTEEIINNLPQIYIETASKKLKRLKKWYGSCGEETDIKLYVDSKSYYQGKGILEFNGDVITVFPTGPLKLVRR